jgi:adenylate cyclase
VGTAQAVRRTSFGRLLLANLFGAAVVVCYLLASSPPERAIDEVGRDLAIVGLFLLVASCSGSILTGRMFRRALGWWDGGRAPSAGELEATLRLPRDQALLAFTLWVGGATLFGGLNLASDGLGYHALRVSAGVVMGGLTTSGLTFLVLERTLRPAFAAAIRSSPSATPVALRQRNVRGRLLLGWALGSGVPLLGIALVAVRPGADLPADVQRALAFLIPAGLIAGAGLASMAAHAVADPLARLRSALTQLGQGDLSVAVEVDDRGDIGLLQAGFNDMVDALRQRRRLELLFDRHIGPEVRVALDDEQRDGGPRLRHVTIMFVDLIGSTELVERSPVLDVKRLLDQFYTTVVTVATEHGGWVHKFLGDGALVVFGAPFELPDRAAAGVAAGLSLRRRLLMAPAVVDIGIGISSGDALIGTVGPEDRADYTLIGRPVHEASRLSDEAKRRPSRLLVSEPTLLSAGVDLDAWGQPELVVIRGQLKGVSVAEPRPSLNELELDV